VILVGLALAAPREQVLVQARHAYQCAVAAGFVEDRGVVAVIDYARPSTEPRLAIVDLRTDAVLLETRVSHGRNSGDDRAVSFSNVEGSNQSSIGVFRTADVYSGKHGRSLHLEGLEPGWNDNARSRAIVLHRADYATDSFVEKWGRLGRSHGCPAVDPAVADTVIDTLAAGTLIVAYAEVPEWLQSSAFLGCGSASR
jgi:hypothetical protein